MSLYRRWIHSREHQLSLRDTNRKVFPFQWGLDSIGSSEGGPATPLEKLKHFSGQCLRDSAAFFEAPPITNAAFKDNHLSFPSCVPGPVESNNTVYCRLFPARKSRVAVVVVPQWNADSTSHLGLCRLLQMVGISALRLTLPYHEERKPPGMERADYMMSPNIGRTLMATRQSVLEVRQAVQWLRSQGYLRVGVVGTSIGSCITYLSFAHDPAIDAAVFNHVSAYVADVVWTGLSTLHVRWGLEDHISLPDLRECWAPISPISHIHRLALNYRPHLLITARYDLTFRPELTEKVFQEYDRQGLPYNRADLPCGHYTTAHSPFKYLDGWHIARFLRRHLAQEESPASMPQSGQYLEAGKRSKGGRGKSQGVGQGREARARARFEDS
jgi:hypothetical protein